MSKILQISERLEKSGGDCPCHSMVTCPDKAQEYWDYYDNDVEWLLEKLHMVDKGLKRIASMAGHPDAAHGCYLICSEVRKVLEEINE